MNSNFSKLLLVFGLTLTSVIASACSPTISSKTEDSPSSVQGSVQSKNNGSNSVLEDLVINKNEVGGEVKYYPFEYSGQKMQVMAVKTEDGKVRTAFDTCQVCNGSPRAYYEQDGDVVVCQNCGNRFTMSMIEEQKGGCNPIPIMSEDKTETDDKIVIDAGFLKENKRLFTANWRTR